MPKMGNDVFFWLGIGIDERKIYFLILCVNSCKFNEQTDVIFSIDLFLGFYHWLHLELVFMNALIPQNFE